MTHDPCYEKRIRLLREALERISAHANAYTMRAAVEANAALLADDALATKPTPPEAKEVPRYVGGVALQPGADPSEAYLLKCEKEGLI